MSVYHITSRNGNRKWKWKVHKDKVVYQGWCLTEQDARDAEQAKKDVLKKNNDNIPKHEGEKYEVDESENGVKITSNSVNIKTAEELLSYSKIDMEKYDIERIKVNKWEVTVKLKQPDASHLLKQCTNHQIKVWLKPKVKDPIAIAVKKIIEEIPEFAFPNFIVKKVEGEFVAEIALYDSHIGKLAYGLETGQGDYDSKIAADNYIRVAEENLQSCIRETNKQIAKFVFVVGNDYFHVENLKEETPFGGNKLDVDTRLTLVYETGLKAALKVIYMLLKVAPVEILWVPGNHDPLISFFLTEVIKAHFRNTKKVLVDNSPQWRKARMWGNLLVGFSHNAEGRKLEATVNMLPQYFPEEWGKSKFREWHVGHLHKKGEKKFAPVNTVGGVVVRRIGALSKIDAWHYQHGFVDAVPCGESFVWTKDRGVKHVNTEYILD